MQPENSHHLILHVVGLRRSLWCTWIIGYRPVAQCIVQNTTFPGPGLAERGASRCAAWIIDLSICQFLNTLEALQLSIFLPFRKHWREMLQLRILSSSIGLFILYGVWETFFFRFVVCRIAAQLPWCHCLREHFISPKRRLRSLWRPGEFVRTGGITETQPEQLSSTIYVCKYDGMCIP